MFYVRCFRLVPYSVEKMFGIINDVSSYTKFIPGCSIITILNQSNNELIAEINLVANSVIKSLITHNFFVKNKSIVIFLIKSPFKSFYGCWRFIPVTDIFSKVEYIAYYEFQSIIVERVFNCVFQKICSNIVEIFISRANQIYGSI